MRNPSLTAHAKRMRSNATEAETRMWLALRAGRLCNVKFRRQKVIGPYIADFVAREPMLVIEIDGDTHGESAEYDARRTGFLEGEGYRVIRFSNLEVMTNLDGVLSMIATTIALPLSQPSPLKGRGL